MHMQTYASIKGGDFLLAIRLSKNSILKDPKHKILGAFYYYVPAKKWEQYKLIKCNIKVSKMLKQKTLAMQNSQLLASESG